jgi:hypothetical protein
MTSCPTVLTPLGITTRTSRTPGNESAATLNFTLSCSSGFLAASSGFIATGNTSAVTPSPLTST